jgi:hypothetical protein
MRHAWKETRYADPRALRCGGLDAASEAANANTRRERSIAAGAVFPRDAVARIYRPARSAMTSGTARTRRWLLRFDRRRPPFVEPLMGWTGGNDTLTQVELTFPSREAALAYARRQGLAYVVEGNDSRLASSQADGETRRTA